MKKFFTSHPNAKFTAAQVDKLMAAFPKKEHRGGNEAKIGVVTSWVQVYQKWDKDSAGKAVTKTDDQWQPSKLYFQDLKNGKKKTLGNVISRATSIILFCNTEMTEKDEMRLIKFPKITDANGNSYGGVAGGSGPGVQMKYDATINAGMLNTNLMFESLYGCPASVIKKALASGANSLTFNLFTVAVLLLGFFNMEY